MDRLQVLISENADWLMQQVLQYARQQDYLKFTSTLAEAWRISIANVSSTLLTAFELPPEVLEFTPDEDYTRDPIAAFGVEEARKHRARGLTIGMFLSLFKYYRQSYIDLVIAANFDQPSERRYCHFINRCFDRIELGFCTAWTISGERDRLDELQASNRVLANEKNKYLTIFESLHDPVILLDSKGRISNMNHAAARLLIGSAVPGERYYNEESPVQSLPWLEAELELFLERALDTLNFEKRFNTTEGLRYFNVKLERMLDISEKFSGTVVLLNDLTESKQAAVMAERERLARELHDSVTQSLYSLSLFAEWGQSLLSEGDLAGGQERIARIGDISQHALREMRLLLYELQPAVLEQDGLVGALRSRLAAVEQRVGIQTEFLPELDADLPHHIETCLYRIAQEALNNALKHAAAKHVVVRVKVNEQNIMLEVSDNGQGFDPTVMPGEGCFGLNNMRSRADRLGGHLTLQAAPGQGTRVRVDIAAPSLATSDGHPEPAQSLEVHP